MRLHLLVLAALLAAGCAAPAPPADDEPGPIDLTGRLGLLAVDTTTRQVTVLTETTGYGWMSPSGALVAWIDDRFAILLSTADNAREVIPVGQWMRIYDNATGLELRPGTAVWRPLRGGADVASAPIDDAPIPGTRWNWASDDLAVLGAEYVPQGRPPPCANDIYVQAEQNVRTLGCHLRVAGDGRAAWSEGGAIRVLEGPGDITNLTPGGAGDIANDTYVNSENPVFTADDVFYLRVTGGTKVVRTDVVGAGGEVVASLDGPRRLALHDVSQDGKFLLVRVFERGG